MKYNKYEIIAKERGYTITEEGVVYSPKGKPVGTQGKNKYKYFSFRIDGKIVKVYFHRFQAYIKFGDSLYERELLVRHLDGDLLNNSSNNIELGTNSDNMKDIPKNIRIQKASNANKKYSDDLVLEILQDREKGTTYKGLMAKYNISSKGTLSNIINKRLVVRNSNYTI